jgi:anti-sigma B factor antagonist
MGLKINIKSDDSFGAKVSIEGSLDSDTYLEFEKKIEPLISGETKNAILDLEKLSYISSAGLGSVFKLSKALKGKGGQLLMTRLQPQIKKVFDVIKALPAESLFSSVEEADKYLDHIMNVENKKSKGGENDS